MKRRKALRTAAPGCWSVYRVAPDGDHLMRSGLTFQQAVKFAETVISTLGKAERVSLREGWLVSWGTVIHRF